MATSFPAKTELSDMLNLFQKYHIPIDESQKTTLQNFIENYHDDRNTFISQILDARYHKDESLEIEQLSSDILNVILHRFIKITELSTANIVKVVTVIINDVDKAEDMNIDEVCDVLMQNNICGRTFVRGTDEYINAAKFCNLFKSVSNWKKNKKCFRKMWVQISKWNDTEIHQIIDEEEIAADILESKVCFFIETFEICV